MCWYYIKEQFEYNNKCYDNWPSKTYKLYDIKRICVDITPENYYLDNNDNIFKKSYLTCKNCCQAGTEENHNCNSCIDEFKYKYNNNCLKECTNNLQKIGDEKICLNECKSEQFEYNNTFYINCPEGYYYLDNDDIYKKCNKLWKKM